MQIQSKCETVIIVAGGKGERMKSDVPKQFIELKSKPILMHTINVFYNYNKQMDIIVVLPEIQIEQWHSLCKRHAFAINHQVVAGGIERFDSVKNGLKLADNKGIIAVHDGVRPLVSTQTISDCFKEAAISGAAIPVIDINESIRYVDEYENKAVDRSKFKIVQTPQVFKADILKEAYKQQYSPAFTDDASVVEAFGVKIKTVQGNRENIKITTPIDLKLAELTL
ncbi:MAG: 2-C-methyl-D-erythritol 4-phosphate cytidylyltransferase [Bacteroidales bacterium 36-12]|nr:MAG: 2-C-methyl-D-erythritol 4-phosphate cytidylyltransferase [Bacteroidales bacterium 36-12]